jgi:hypothetical protein
MNIAELNNLVAQYDREKGLGRRLFGDTPEINALKAYIKAIETVGAPEFNTIPTMNNFRNFCSDHGYNIDISEAFLQSGRASAGIFNALNQPELILQLDISPILERIHTELTNYLDARIQPLIVQPFLNVLVFNHPVHNHLPVAEKPLSNLEVGG